MKSLTVLSYNIEGIPLFLWEHDRYRDIGEILGKRRRQGSAPGLVILQEAFHQRTRELNETAGYPHCVFGPPKKRWRLGSGLVVLSEFPIVKLDQTIYQHSAGWDSFAQKGILCVRLQLPQGELDVYATHLNANPTLNFWTSIKTTQKVRESQVRHIAAFLKKNDLGQRPAIFAGDFNFKPGEKDYKLFKAASKMKDACEEYYFPPKHTSVKEIFLRKNSMHEWQNGIDHQFFLNTHTSPFCLNPVFLERNFRSLVRGRRLSDHNALEIRYSLN